MKGLLFAIVAFAAVAFARYKIFELDEKPTAKLYEKPVWLRQLLIPKDQIPSGYGRTSGDVPNAVKLDGAMTQVPRLASANLPQQSDIQEVLVQAFASSSGHKLHVVTARYPTVDALARLGVERFTAPKYHVIDHCLTVIDGDDEDAVKLFHEVFAAHAAKMKKVRVQVEKSLVGSNALLKFMADLMVGAFGFILALFFTKYFLIVRQTED